MIKQRTLCFQAEGSLFLDYYMLPLPLEVESFEPLSVEVVGSCIDAELLLPELGPISPFFGDLILRPDFFAAFLGAAFFEAPFFDTWLDEDFEAVFFAAFLGAAFFGAAFLEGAFFAAFLLLAFFGAAFFAALFTDFFAAFFGAAFFADFFFALAICDLFLVLGKSF